MSDTEISISTGETIEITFSISDNGDLDEIIKIKTENKEFGDYDFRHVEKFTWTPTEDDVGTHTFEVNGEEISIEVNEIPDSAIAHYDPMNISLSDGETITSITDETSEGNDLTGESTYRESGINGNPSIEFDGSSDSFISDPITERAHPWTAFVVVDGGHGNFEGIVGFNDTSVTYVRNDSSNRWGIYAGEGLNGTTTNKRIISAVFDEDNSFIRENGSETASGDAGSRPFNIIGLGHRTSADRQYYSGLMGEVLICDERLSFSEIEQQENRLANKWDFSI